MGHLVRDHLARGRADEGHGLTAAQLGRSRGNRSLATANGVPFLRKQEARQEAARCASSDGTAVEVSEGIVVEVSDEAAVAAASHSACLFHWGSFQLLVAGERVSN